MVPLGFFETSHAAAARQYYSLGLYYVSGARLPTTIQGSFVPNLNHTLHTKSTTTTSPQQDRNHFLGTLLLLHLLLAQNPTPGL
jgi:hypothetical protein